MKRLLRVARGAVGLTRGWAALTLLLLVACDSAGIDAAWEREHIFLEKYGEQFLLQAEFVEVRRKSNDSYAFRTKDGGLLEVEFPSNAFSWRDSHGAVKHANTINRATDGRITEEQVRYWIRALDHLNTFLISKQELPGCKGVHISSSSSTTMVTTPSAGWFYVPITEKNRIYCVGTTGFLQNLLGYNSYFLAIRPVSEEWYFGERK